MCQHTSTKSAANIASDFEKPDGLTVIYPDQLQKFLENLEVDRIAGIGTKTQQVLKDEMVIQTIGQLAKHDVQKLKDRFGKKLPFSPVSKIVFFGSFIPLLVSA